MNFFDAISTAEAFREANGYTNKDMADIFEVTLTTYHRWVMKASEGVTVDSESVDSLIEWATLTHQNTTPTPEVPENEGPEQVPLEDPEESEQEPTPPEEETVDGALEDPDLPEENPYYRPITVSEFQFQVTLCDLNTYAYRRTLIEATLDVLFDLPLGENYAREVLVAINFPEPEVRICLQGEAFSLTIPKSHSVMHHRTSDLHYGMYLDHFLLTWLDLVTFGDEEEEEEEEDPHWLLGKKVWCTDPAYMANKGHTQPRLDIILTVKSISPDGKTIRLTHPAGTDVVTSPKYVQVLPS